MDTSNTKPDFDWDAFTELSRKASPLALRLVEVINHHVAGNNNEVDPAILCRALAMFQAGVVAKAPKPYRGAFLNRFLDEFEFILNQSIRLVDAQASGQAPMAPQQSSLVN